MPGGARRVPAAGSGWSRLWAPYSEDTYADALAALRPGQSVLDIGAGDLRFARRAAAKGCRVLAVEVQAEVVQRGLAAGPLPDGLTVITVDARDWPFPAALDTAVLLMRHCEDYALYVRKLRAAGCPILVTNARWGLGVEVVPLARGVPYDRDRLGWYACVPCGATGFNPGDPARLTAAVERRVMNVEGCPACQQR